MKQNLTIQQYQKLYGDLQFERAGLFKILQENFHCRNILYPGCSVHITPSFFFPHVVYIDQNPDAAAFFLNTSLILEFINRNKKYKQTPYIRFLEQDYSISIPLMEEEYDLLISLFAGNVFRSCKQFLKKGGIFVTHHFQNEVREAATDPDYSLIFVVQYRKRKYILVDNHLEDFLKPEINVPDKRYIRQTSSGYEYQESEDYFIFKKM